MSLLTLQYRSPQTGPPIVKRGNLGLLLALLAGMLVVAGARLFSGGAGPTNTTTVISVVDARTNKPIPITITNRNPNVVITSVSPNVVRLQGANRGLIMINSPGYQSMGMALGGNFPPQMNIGLWPAPAGTAATPPATSSPAAPVSGN